MVNVLSIKIVPDVVVAGTIVPCQVCWERRENSSRRKLQESAVGDGVHATAPGVVQLSHKSASKMLHRGNLQPVVMTIRSCGKLRHGGKPGIRGLPVGKRRKAPWAYRLMTIHLRLKGLVYGAGSDVLCVNAPHGSQFMLQTKAPLHEIGRMKFPVRYGRDGHG